MNLLVCITTSIKGDQAYRVGSGRGQVKGKQRGSSCTQEIRECASQGLKYILLILSSFFSSRLCAALFRLFIHYSYTEIYDISLYEHMSK